MIFLELTSDKSLHFILEHLQDLLKTPGVSGNEEKVADYIFSKMKRYGSVFRDKISNVSLRNSASDPKILITAHMDSVGYIVKEIHNEKEATLLPVAIAPLSLYDYVPAKIISEKYEINGEISRSEEVTKFYSNKGELSFTEADVEVGDQTIVNIPYKLNLDNMMVKGCWLDNRVGLSILLSLIDTFAYDNNNFHFLASVREEIGGKGIESFLRSNQNFDFAIVIDATWIQPTVKLNEGPVCTIWDPGVVLRLQDRKLLSKVAKQNEIPLQKEVLDSGGSDAGPLTRAGIPTFCIMFPVVRLHSPAEETSLTDIYQTQLLVKNLAKNLECLP